MLKAKDLMTEHVFSVHENTPIMEVVEIMAKEEITGIPVIDDNDMLVGILSEKDILHLFVMPYETIADKDVHNFMTQPAVSFDKDESLKDVCICLFNSHFRRVPVTSDGKLVGILSRCDFIKYILKTIIEPAKAHS